jgi:hypothetical protein
LLGISLQIHIKVVFIVETIEHLPIHYQKRALQTLIKVLM